MQRGNLKTCIWLLGAVLIPLVAALGNGPFAAEEMALRLVDLSSTPVIIGRGEGMRAMLEHILDTEYCGDAMLEGVTQAAALRGEAPVDGVGFVRLAEEDWPAVLAEMTEEEVRCMLQEGKMKSGAEVRHLCNMISLLGSTKENVDEVLQLLRQMAGQTTPEWDSLLLRALSCAWIHLTLERIGAQKALELGRYWGDARGVDSRELKVFVYSLGICNAFEECKTDEDRAEMARFMGEMSERCTTGDTALVIDKISAGGEFFHPNPVSDDSSAFGPPYAGAPGWIGSLQRRRMAERFLDWRPPRFRRDQETGNLVAAPPTPQDVQNMLAARAATELAADEKDLTDLREVYGAWEEDGVVAEPPAAKEK